MSSNTGNGTASSSLPRLGPAWRSGNQGGRGFQPPPAVPSDRDASSRSSLAGGGVNPRDRSGLSGTNDSDPKRDSNRNSFSALLDSEEDGSQSLSSSGGNNGSAKQHEEGGAFLRRGSTGDGRAFSSRSEGLRSSVGTSYNRSSLGGTGSGLATRTSGSGRSLAELASRVSAPSSGSGGRNHSMASIGHRSGFEDSGSGGGSRLSALRGDSVHVEDKKVIRFTREKLLSMRPRPNPDKDKLPESLKHLEGTALLSEEPLDPVCWDTFDAEEIWAQAARERTSRGSISTGIPAKTGTPGSSLRSLSESSERLRREMDSEDRRPSVGGGAGRWQRGVALPPSDEQMKGGRIGRYEDAENPEDLWDDPTTPGGETGAAADFSAFGGSLDDEPKRSSSASVGSDGFDLASMSEAARKFEEDLHGVKTHSDLNGVAIDVGDDDPAAASHSVDPLRPLAAAGTTIRSGSGDDVNVFEDFGAPEEASDEPAIKSGDEQSASSRLMQMIGVSPKETATVTDDSSSKLVSSWGAGSASGSEAGELQDPSDKEAESSLSSNIFAGFSSTVPRNPWGDPIISTANNSTQEKEGLDLAARLRAVAEEQKTREAADLEQRQREEAERRRQQEEEEEKRLAVLQKQQQAEVQARQQQAAMQAPPQQQNQGHSQVELILMERISAKLESSWGRSDLMSVLSTLHSEDSRVIPLLGSVDALRALISRHPRRIALAKDPAFGAEMAVLVMTNAQWQQQQAAQDMQRRQQQEHQQLQAAQQAAAAKAKAEAEAARENAARSIKITNAPWYYADPQGNVQGPFGGDEMRQWLEAGYFKGDLPISQNPSGSFRSLSSLFPDLSIAFKPTDSSALEEELKARAAEEEVRLKAEAARAEAEAEAAKAEAAKAEAAKAEAARVEAAKAESDAREAAERERIAAEEAAALKEKADNDARALAETPAQIETNVNTEVKSATTNQNQSDQLKMLLGLGAIKINDGNSDKGVNIAGLPNPNNREVIQSSVLQQNTEPRPQSKVSKPKVPIKVISEVAPTPDVAPVPSPVPAPAPAWGGAGTGKNIGRRKTMSEIQQEEARVAARLAKQRDSLPRNSSGGWANIAASGGTTAWSGAAVIPTPGGSTSILSSSAVVSGGNGGTSMQQSRIKQQASVTIAQKQAMAQTQSSTTQKTMEEFGANGKMSPALETWCKDQMRKLSGSDDLTLVAFCMTLSDPIEIRQYLTAYLGSSAQVNNFATDFINKKTGATKKQEQWETTVSSKKGRKKKGGASK